MGSTGCWAICWRTAVPATGTKHAVAPPPSSAGRLLGLSKAIARQLLTVAENRVALLLVEAQEGRERLLRAILLALGVAAFGLLAGIAFTGAVVVSLWGLSPLGALLALTGVYGAMAVCLYRRLTRLLHDWQAFSATLEQLRKDRACLEENLK